MWLQFAPPVLRWITVACFVVLVLALLAMPKEERARLLRGMRRRPARRLPPATLHDLLNTPETGDTSVAGPSSSDLERESPDPLRKLNTVAIATQTALVVSAVVMLALLLWMMIAFISNVPGWR